MKYVLPIILFSTLVSNCCFGQKSDSLFAVFKTNKELQQGTKIPNDRLSDEMKVLYYTLLIESDLSTLEKYANDPNPAIRSLMFIGLAQKQAPDTILERIYLKHSNDTTTFESGSGCVVTNWHVNEWMKMNLNWIRKGELREIDFKNEIERIKEKYNTGLRIIIPGRQFNRIKRSELLILERLLFSDSNYVVQSFSIYDGTKIMASNSNRITSEMKKSIGDHNNSFFAFEEIKFKAHNDTIRRWSGLLLRIE